MIQLGIVISGGNLTLPARVDLNGTIIARKALSYDQIFSYTGSLTVQGINVILNKEIFLPVVAFLMVNWGNHSFLKAD